MTSKSSQNLAHAIAKLTLLHDGESGVSEVVAFGKAAVPALRAILFQREPSGLFQIRCRAVEALAALRAYDVLVDFLHHHEPAADPIERLGDDAVINAVAQGLKGLRDERVFSSAAAPCRKAGVDGGNWCFGRLSSRRGNTGIDRRA